MRRFWKQGEPYVWATGAALSLVLAMTFCLLYVVLANGLAVFWPAELALFKLKDGSRLLGEIVQEERDPVSEAVVRYQLKIGNRDLYGLDFRWVPADEVAAIERPADAIALERQEYGNFYGFLKRIDSEAVQTPAAATANWQDLGRARAALKDRRQRVETLDERISELNNQMEGIEHTLAELRHDGVPETAAKYRKVQARERAIKQEFEGLVSRLHEATAALRAPKAVFADASGTEKPIVLAEIVRAYRPNAMSFGAKLLHYADKVRELLFEEPRESNTEGGLYPAIFGTVMLIFLMSIFSFPLGVVAGIYLREYAKEGVLVRLVRIAVNNLAGIPSIVYGIFGLGFFVYGLGSAIDQLFFPERLPAPTFGTGGILWASLTLGLLTVPVVIVATEEALGAIPANIRDGSLALGATKFQTLVKLLIPMASPGIMTGFILAMARAAGEVAPLMITGVVKLAPALPVDGTFPYFHLDRKFMHLGFHIYDIGFQSPNVEAAKPMVYVTTLLLLLIVILLSSMAIHLRNKMKKKYALSGNV